MKKVYIVMDRVETCGETFGPDVEEVFSSKKKAIKYINDLWLDCIFSYNPHTEEYIREISDYTKAFKFIVEREVQ